MDQFDWDALTIEHLGRLFINNSLVGVLQVMREIYRGDMGALPIDRIPPLVISFGKGLKIKVEMLKEEMTDEGIANLMRRLREEGS